MVELTKKLQKYGNAYAILVPKALIDCKVFEIGEELKVTLEKAKSLKGDPSQEQTGEQRHWYSYLGLRTANRFVLEFLEFLPIKGAGEFVT